MRRRPRGEDGNIIILFALLLLLLLCFVAFGTEAGRWFLVRAEISKSVDSGALIAAKNISNPNADPRVLAREFCAENFRAGALGTPASGAGAPAFSAQFVDLDKVKVDGQASSPAILGKLLGVDNVSVSSSGTAQKREAEIMLVLDRSGSMSGTPLLDLKRASKSFIDFFVASQDKDKVGLISFANAVKVDRALGTNFVTPMKTSIDALVANGGTDTEDAIDQADGPTGFTDQTGVVGDRRIQQFMIFFSDGRPTALRDRFLFKGVAYDGVGCATGDCTPASIGGTTQAYNRLGRVDLEDYYADATLNPATTGDGKILTLSKCGAFTPSVRWYAFDADPVPGYAADACGIPYRTSLATWICDHAVSRALAHAQELKDEKITIFVVGLGSVNRTFLEQLASSPDLVYYAPSSSQLQSLFQRIAQEIKLRLVQ